MKILDPDDKPVPQGEGGQIAVRSPWQTLGYWNQPDETAATYGADGYIRLGDVGRFDETGWLHVSGRLKEMIITGGENVFPVEVEQALNELPGVVQAVAFGLPDDYWGERVEAAVTVRPGEGVTADALRASVRESLAGYKVPKRIHVVDALPLTPNNKPDRRALQERFADG
jgi:acyl-CoA synthetase (AMP-forming)/AMP-acid ligase II